MAQHPFAAQARASLEENGIVFNADGSTYKRNDQTTNPSQTNQTQDSQAPDNAVKITPPQEQQQSSAQDERDRLIEMQREEIERLKASQNQYNQQAQSQPSIREQELERELSELRGKLHTQTQEEQNDEFRELLERKGFDSENLDDDVIVELRDTLFRPVANKIKALEERLGKAESHYREPTEKEKRAQILKKADEELYRKIPDIDAIYNSRAFKERLKKKDDRFPFKKTYGDAIQEAYENGNTDFIVDEVKAFMNGTVPDLATIADVGATNGVGTGQSKQTDEPGYTFSNEEAEQMLRKRQMGDLSKAEYSEYRAKLDANRSRV